MTFRTGTQRINPLGLLTTSLGVLLASAVVGAAVYAQAPDKQPPTELPKVLPPAKTADPKADPKMGELPTPKTFEPGGARMPRLGQRPLGTTPKPTEEDLKMLGQFVKGVVDPKNTLDVVQGRTRLILLNHVPKQTQIADDTIAAFNLLGPKQLTVLGKKIGTTVLTLWFTDPDNKDNEKIISYLVRVIPDPEIRERVEMVFSELEKEIAKVFPDSHIRITLVGDKVVVRGQAKDIAESTQIMRIIRANWLSYNGKNEDIVPDAKKVPVNNVNVNINPNDPLNPTGTPGLESYEIEGGNQIINLIRIPGEQQVMLRVTVAEVNRAAARSIGLNFAFLNNAGAPVAVVGNGAARVGGGGNALAGGNIFGGALANGINANVLAFLDNGQIPIAINALKTLSYAKSLAEPNLVALNGQRASFLSGGQFPVPVLGGFGAVPGVGGGLQGVQFVPFGVQVSFVPIITDRDRIRLTVSATVSTRDVASGTNIGGSAVAGLNTRNFTSTVEMREGQSMAVAGLIQNNSGANSSRIPFLADIPFLNKLGGLDSIQTGEQELVILITPELVHPLEKKELSKLPGSDIFEPNDCEFYLHGRLESYRARDYRSPVMTDIHRIMRWKRCEEQYIFGPVGHSVDPNYPAP